jgi:hypothetical protein
VINETGRRSADLSCSNRLIGALIPVAFLSLDNSLTEEEHAENDFLSPAQGRNVGENDGRASQG